VRLHQVRHCVLRAVKAAGVQLGGHPGAAVAPLYLGMDLLDRRDQPVPPLLRRGTRSRVEGNKRIVLETPGERQEVQHFVGTTRKRPGGNISTRFSLSRGQHFGK
jgi:hypothetical protein